MSALQGRLRPRNYLGWSLFALLVTAFVAPAAFSSAGSPGTALSAEDREAIRRLADSYATAWLEGNPEAVVENFTEDAVLMPHHGVAPVKGVEAIRRFWWPPDSPPVSVSRIRLVPEEISGEAGLGYVRGRFSLVFTMEGAEGTQTFSNEGNYLMIVRKEAGGWRIARYIWNDPVPQTE
jgi:uncharacterized protein (TIGR02246 family)